MKTRIVTIVLTLIFLFVSCGKEIQKYEDSRFLFGTYIKIMVYDKDVELAKKSVDKAFDEIERIDKKFNSKYEGSIIDVLNKSSDKIINLDDEGEKIFEEVEKVYKLSHKKYDITIGPLLKLWGFTDEMIDSLTLKIPKKEEIEFTKTFVDYGKVKLKDKKLILESPVKEIDTGSFLKGYALARAKQILKDNGIESAFLTSISSIDLLGTKPDNKPWKIGVQNPMYPNELLGVVSLKDKALGISGDYQTYVEIAGKMYHHILDKESGYPVKDKKMVVVITDSAFIADLYSTAFFLMPIDEVIEFVDSQDNLEVMIVDEEMHIIKSKNFELEEIKN